MRVKIMGKVWDLQLVQQMRNDHGVCEAPDRPGKTIKIASYLRGQRRLEVLIHELTHAGNWHLDEEFVEQFAQDLARTLWRLGYRCTEEKN